MPEGDTIFRAARTLHRVLAGKEVTRFESVYPALTRIAEDHPIVGRTIESVSARGKHLPKVELRQDLVHCHLILAGQLSALSQCALGRVQLVPLALGQTQQQVCQKRA